MHEMIFIMLLFFDEFYMKQRKMVQMKFNPNADYKDSFWQSLTFPLWIKEMIRVQGNNKSALCNSFGKVLGYVVVSDKDLCLSTDKSNFHFTPKWLNSLFNDSKKKMNFCHGLCPFCVCVYGQNFNCKFRSILEKIGKKYQNLHFLGLKLPLTHVLKLINCYLLTWSQAWEAAPWASWRWWGAAMPL